jgi:branched-chain amino acid transport system ATP-binding protein
MLELDNVHVFYGSSHILQGISMGIKKNEVVSLLGRNGAGKTTTLRTIMGLVKPKSGSIQLMGKEIGGRSSYSISHMGDRKSTRLNSSH